MKIDFQHAIDHVRRCLEEEEDLEETVASLRQLRMAMEGMKLSSLDLYNVESLVQELLKESQKHDAQAFLCQVKSMQEIPIVLLIDHESLVSFEKISKYFYERFHEAQQEFCELPLSLKEGLHLLTIQKINEDARAFMEWRMYIKWELGEMLSLAKSAKLFECKKTIKLVDQALMDELAEEDELGIADDFKKEQWLRYCAGAENLNLPLLKGELIAQLYGQSDEAFAALLQYAKETQNSQSQILLDCAEKLRYFKNQAKDLSIEIGDDREVFLDVDSLSPSDIHYLTPSMRKIKIGKNISKEQAEKVFIESQEMKYLTNLSVDSEFIDDLDLSRFPALEVFNEHALTPDE